LCRSGQDAQRHRGPIFVGAPREVDAFWDWALLELLHSGLRVEEA
jgi:hypothetical protein